MTGRERLTAIFRGELPDRPGVRLWGLHPGQRLLNPAYEPVYRLAMSLTDLMASAHSPFSLHWGRRSDDICESSEAPTDPAVAATAAVAESASEEWVDVVTCVRTPSGTLRSAYRKSRLGNPGYRKEYLLKEPDDLKKVLAIPYEPYPFSAEYYHHLESTIGDRGLAMFELSHAMHGLEVLIGSENFAFWSIDERGLLLEAIDEFSRRIREHVVSAFQAGLKPVFGWVGPELCIPPLMSLRDFEEFVFQFDKPLIDLIHEGGSRVWVHCHGKMGPVLERFAEMGVDVLNPIEPPPMGDVTLKEAFKRAGDRMGLEGNIETHDLMTASSEEIRALVHEALAAGTGRRFILCPSSGYMEFAAPQKQYIENLLAFVEEGVRYAESMKA